MQKFLFTILFLFSTTLFAAGSDGIALNTRYVKGSWAPEKEVPSSFYDVPGDRAAASTEKNEAHGISVDDVFAENAQPLTEESFKSMVVKKAPKKRRAVKTAKKLRAKKKAQKR